MHPVSCLERQSPFPAFPFQMALWRHVLCLVAHLGHGDGERDAVGVDMPVHVVVGLPEEFKQVALALAGVLDEPALREDPVLRVQLARLLRLRGVRAAQLEIDGVIRAVAARDHGRERLDELLALGLEILARVGGVPVGHLVDRRPQNGAERGGFVSRDRVFRRRAPVGLLRRFVILRPSLACVG